MKKVVLISIFYLMASSVSKAQVTGRTMLDGSGCSNKVSVNGKRVYSSSEFEGCFSVPVDLKSNRIFIETPSVSIEIINIPTNAKANIGEITVPALKVVEEFQNLLDIDESFSQTSHAELFGYEIMNQLSEPYLAFKCGELKYKIYDLTFDVKQRKVVIDWKYIKKCKE